MLLLLLATAITANLLGLFELPVLGGSAQPAGSFGTGALAAFVATPCAGPFLGAALGTALLLPSAGGRWCSPRSASGWRCRSSFSPSFPRCGPTAEARSVDAPAATLPRHPRWPRARWPRCGCSIGRRGSGGWFSASAAVLVLAFCWRSDESSGAAAARPAGAVARSPSSAASPRSPCAARCRDRVSAIGGRRTVERGDGRLRAPQGKPVFVYFTADWCLSCKVNETTSIDRSEVRDAFGKAGVKVLAGDWTNGDPEITRFLESRGRAGVPLYLWYAPGKPRRRAAAGADAGHAHRPRSGPLAQTPSAPRPSSRQPTSEEPASSPVAEHRPPIGSRSTITKSAHLPGSRAPILSSAKPA